MASLNKLCSQPCSQTCFFGDRTHLTQGGPASLPRSDIYSQSRRKAVPYSVNVRSSAAIAASKLVTILGKGGAGKTTAAVLLAKYYASTGNRTCFVTQSPHDRTADELLGFPISSSRQSLPGDPLTVLRLETTKLILEPILKAKQLDARLGFSQGALNEVVGDELSILPGFDSLLAVASLEGLLRPHSAGGLLASLTGGEGEEFDIVVFDGPSSGEVLRMVGAPERTRWYLRRFREVAEKTDVGRVVLPSVARFVDSALGPPRGRGERSTTQVWEAAEELLTEAVNNFQDPRRFCAFLVVEPSRPPSVSTALRLWGGAMQSGVPISGALFTPRQDGEEVEQSVEDNFAPLPTLALPFLPGGAKIEWQNSVKGMSKLLDGVSGLPAPVAIDVGAGTVKLFLPGFDKWEVKLSQWRQASELVVEVGDQRRNIAIPIGMRGKVVGAKFEGRTLSVTLKK